MPLAGSLTRRLEGIYACLGLLLRGIDLVIWAGRAGAFVVVAESVTVRTGLSHVGTGAGNGAENRRCCE